MSCNMQLIRPIGPIDSVYYNLKFLTSNVNYTKLNQWTHLPPFILFTVEKMAFPFGFLWWRHFISNPQSKLFLLAYTTKLLITELRSHYYQEGRKKENKALWHFKIKILDFEEFILSITGNSTIFWGPWTKLC